MPMDDKTVMYIVRVATKDAAPLYSPLVRITTVKVIKLWRRLYTILDDELYHEDLNDVLNGYDVTSFTKIMYK